jgi:hypothetical protein
MVRAIGRNFSHGLIAFEVNNFRVSKNYVKLHASEGLLGRFQHQQSAWADAFHRRRSELTAL